MKIYGVTLEMKTTEQFKCRVVLIFKNWFYSFLKILHYSDALKRVNEA